VPDERNKFERSDRRDAERPHLKFGEALFSARANAHLSRPEAAEAAGISYPMLANVESGRRRASDDIIERLAPVLGLRPDRMREVRDALEADSTRFSTGIGLGSYLAGRRDTLVGLTEIVEPNPADASQVEQWSSRLLVELQIAEAMVLAANPGQTKGVAPRMQMISAIIRDLGSLGDTDLARVRGYVDGLREARDRAATAVSPESPQPLIRVPDTPFGPMHKWSVPEWITVADYEPREDLSRRLRQYRNEAAHSVAIRASRFTDDVKGLMQLALAKIGAEGKTWPHGDDIRTAAYIGERLAQDVAASEPGMVEPGVWVQIVGLRLFPMKEPRRVRTLDWILRMALVGTLIWPEVDSRLDFVTRCLQLYAEDLLLIEDRP
jgi:transcriptional regulator with XRE-family HTH domain